jgi:hypothetical protein
LLSGNGKSSKDYENQNRANAFQGALKKRH